MARLHTPAFAVQVAPFAASDAITKKKEIIVSNGMLL